MIPEQEPVKNHYGNNLATNFDFEFFIENESQLLVTHTDFNGVVTYPQLGIDYTIKSVGQTDGSEITFPIQGSKYNILGWNEGTDEKELLSISLNIPIVQEAEYNESGDLNKHNLENSLDYLTRICQMINRLLKRALKAPEGFKNSEGKEFNLSLPLPKANNVFKWTDDETALENYDIIGENNSFKTAVNKNIDQFKDDIQSQLTEFEGSTNENIQSLEEGVNSRIDEFETETNQNIQSLTDDVNSKIQTFENNTNNNIDQFKDDIQSQLTEFEGSTNEDIQSFTDDVNNKINEFEGSVEERIEQVTEAAGKINELDNAIEETKQASANATTAAQTAQQAAEEAIEATVNKADKSYVDNELETVNTKLETKADKSYVETELETVNTDLKTKADKSYVDDELESVNTKLETKADKSYVDDELNSVNVKLETYATKDFATTSSMPSSKYVNLTLGAARSTYTAPASGWFHFLGNWDNANGCIKMIANSSGYRIQTPATNTTGFHGFILPVRKDEVVGIDYTVKPTEVVFRFCYAEGAK